MISNPLFKKNMIGIIKTGIIFLVILLMYNAVVIYMYDPKFVDTLSQFQNMAPEMMSLFGMNGSSQTLIGFMDTYLFGMLMLVLPMVFSIIVINKIIMSYIDRGSMAAIITTGNTRVKIITTQLVSALTGMLLLFVTNALLTIFMAQIMFPGELAVGKYLLLNVDAFLIQLVIIGIIFLAACTCNESKRFYLIGAGIPVLFYIIQMMANLGDKLKAFKYMTIFTLFTHTEIVDGKCPAWQMIVLFVTAAALYSAGIGIFRKRKLML